MRDQNFIPGAPIAVVGAAGFIGMHAAKRLADISRDLRCFSRRLPETHEVSGFNWIMGRISDRKALMEAVAGCDTVVHLASSTTPVSASQDVVAAAEGEIVDSLRLFDACVAAGVRRVIYISSGGTVYGVPTVLPTPEDAPTNPISAYGVAKLTVENYLEVFRRQHGLDYRILRLSNVYGPLQKATRNQGVVASLIACALQERPLEIWGDGKVVRDFIYVDDVAEAIVKAVGHQGANRVFNIGSGEGTSILDIADMIGEIFGRSLPRVHHAAAKHDVPISILDRSRARIELDWSRRTSFSDGLRKSVVWHQSMPTG